jgi:hypothetical protein
MQTLYLYNNQLTGTPPFAHFTWFGSTSLSLGLKTSSCALAGSIPTEFGKLTNMRNLWLNTNNLSGTPPFAHVDWFGKRGAKRPSTDHLLKTTFHRHLLKFQLKTTFRQRGAHQASFFADALSVSHLAHRSTGVQGAHDEESARMQRLCVTARRKKTVR